MNRYFNRFDICEAWWHFANLYHGGGGTPEYAIFGRLSRLRFRLSPCHTGPESLEANGREIFDALVERAGFSPYESEVPA